MLLLGESTNLFNNAIPLLVVAVTPSLDRPLLVLPAVVVIVYLAPIKLTAGVPAVN